LNAKAKLASLGLALIAFLALTGIAVVIFKGMSERDKLESRNDAERTMNLLLASLRDHEDFGSAIEGVAALKDKVVGVGAYSDTGSRLYSWGATPETYSWTRPKGSVPGEMMRTYIDNAGNDSVILPLRPFRVAPAPPPQTQLTGPGEMMGRGPEGRARDRRPYSGFLFTTMRNAEVVYLEIREPAYWAGRRLKTLLFPLVELALAALVLFVRGLVLRNAEYRRRIEEQKNLVVLGTAASTLAHEIKNPLLSIRLQTRILEKTYPEGAQREISIINDEVERLSALSHRVGDYLRDPAGKPSPIEISDMALEVGMRLCGRNVLKVSEAPPPRVLMDSERLRSVLENLVRNALEAGGPEEGVSIQAGLVEGMAGIEVLDRGAGLAADAAGKAFDPFFTTKSRGTGIGLSVCKRFVEAAGGSISLGPRPDGGCIARVLLPPAKG
jgi:two-component system, NtrC family, sensor histidine kinase HydH